MPDSSINATPFLHGTSTMPINTTQLRESLQRHTSLNLIVFKISDHILMRELYGDDVATNLNTQLRQGIEAALRELTVPELSNNTLFPLEAGEYLLTWPDAGPRQYRLADVAFTMKLRVQQHLKREMLRLTGREPHLNVGCATYRHKQDGTQGNDFMLAMRECRILARKGFDLDTLRLSREFKSVLQTRSIQTLYQPIVSFPSGDIMAWEALSRGPEQSPFRSPDILFDLAEEMGMLFALERVCRENAIVRADALAENQKLFLNIHPRTLTDPGFTPGSTREIIEKVGLKPENIVLEITERHSIRDFSLFYKTLDHYRGQGFQVAIDDAGTGYSGLSTIAELKPNFIKIDMSLIRNIDRDPVRRALLETIVAFADKIDSKVIAEGIETQEEASTLLQIGTHFGQGYYLGRPTYPKQQTTIDLSAIRPANQPIALRSTGYSVPVGSYAKPVNIVSPDTLVSEIREYFEENNLNSSIAVTANDEPVGLIMEYHLNRQLSAQYGLALYYKRPAKSVMDASPLIVDENTPVEATAQMAMQRSQLQAYDDVIITKKGKLLGLVTVQTLLNVLAQAQVELAKGTNPLTGLPGNVALENEIECRLRSEARFALIYADLDNFKAYNDTYGFKNGDRIILLLADILTWAIRRHGIRGDITAHIGGDDFVCVLDRNKAERICRAVTRCFKRLVRNCYSPHDREKGWILARGRDGVEREFPLVSVSLAVIDCQGSCSLQEIGERAAQMKHFAKSIPGNVYVVDRRSPVGSQSDSEGHEAEQ
ncbi:GGDEF domain-containing protein [Desulfovibrio mangrovi]|uniref:GGDEF domain-containing protein n=1 Tax=Desulfovibrio mangrovi TaxID=2976983 RepID=UPI0022485067|nr:GGDEF domain-containing protein [Desulfovibrio mangrovi]UZP68049.1 GGDEF domain-containing protein [Desulfovibrio mangrovi]